MEIPTDQLVKALLGNDMRAADIRATAMYYEMALAKQKRGDRHGYKIARRSIECYVEHWPSAQLFLDDLNTRSVEIEGNTSPNCTDKLVIREQA